MNFGAYKIGLKEKIDSKTVIIELILLMTTLYLGDTILQTIKLLAGC